MQKILRFFLLLGLLLPALRAQGVRDIGAVVVNNDSKTLPVRVSANTPELNALANQAFRAHGRYRLAGSGPYVYDIKFTLVGAQQVRVDVTRGSAGAVLSETVSGTSARNALLRAADLAVERTNGLGLKGFFTARLAFISERTGKPEIYTSDLFCGEVKQITRDNAFALTPRWSPDGTRIIYTSYYGSGFPDIYLIDLASMRRDVFMRVKGTNQGARFSPNGRQVAMVLSGTGTPEIYISDTLGHGLARKTQSDAVKSSPCFSPDGSRLVFSSEPGPQLYIMPVGGGGMQRVTAGISNYCAEPDWSRADPNKIAFTCRVGSYQVAVLDLASGRSAQVSHAPFDAQEPAWLADGRHLIYTARDRRSSVLCILDTETGASMPISQGLGSSCLQASVWTP
ncbi:MAG TPA: biopolymer transporter Tol [Opitutaceae bacterium]|nr:biopolymer transporter Tol [Opitutaceae bacterium]